MSRIGKIPITIPEGVTVKIEDNSIFIEGPLGKLEQKLGEEIKAEIKNGRLLISRQKETKSAKALHGLTRALLANMILGVTKGFSKNLELQGTGYRAKLEGKKLILQVGFSHPVSIESPEGIEFKLSGEKKITVSGIDKQRVGNAAAMIRALKKPEPYKGKGIRYRDEFIRKKPGKAAKVGAEEGKYE